MFSQLARSCLALTLFRKACGSSFWRRCSWACQASFPGEMRSCFSSTFLMGLWSSTQKTVPCSGSMPPQSSTVRCTSTTFSPSAATSGFYPPCCRCPRSTPLTRKLTACWAGQQALYWSFLMMELSALVMAEGTKWNLPRNFQKVTIFHSNLRSPRPISSRLVVLKMCSLDQQHITWEFFRNAHSWAPSTPTRSEPAVKAQYLVFLQDLQVVLNP